MPTTARRGPVSGAGRKVGARVGKDAARKWKRTLRRHPAVGIIASVLLAVLAVALLVTGLLAENLLYLLASILSGLGGVAINRARHLEQQRQEQARAKRPTVSQHPKAQEAKDESSSSTPPSSSGVVLCTETRRPIADCGCASRHVATAEGAKRYGLPVGSPMGRRAKAAKPSATTRSGS